MSTSCTSSRTIVRSGLVFTKGQREDARLFGTASWKLRYVELTSDNILSYYTSQGGVETCKMDLRQCQSVLSTPSRSVGNLSDRRLTSGWRIEITLNGRRVVIAALTERGMNSWALALKSNIKQVGIPMATRPLTSRLSIFSGLFKRQLI